VDTELSIRVAGRKVWWAGHLARTSPARSAVRSTPAATAADSVRSTPGPRSTVDRAAPISAAVHPPSGPTSTVGYSRFGGAPPGRRHRPPRMGRHRPRRFEADHFWQPQLAALHRRLVSHDPQLVEVPAASFTFPPNHASFRYQHHDPVHAQLGELLDRPLR